MEIIREKNKYYDDTYDYILIQDNKKLYIDHPGVGDTYWLMSDGTRIGYKEEKEITFEITKENEEVYSLFEDLYMEVVNGRPSGMDEDFKDTYEYHILVDEDKNINWISDNGPEEGEDRVTISKQDDKIVLKFVRNDIINKYEFKSSEYISVRFRNDGSRYGFFHTSFQNLYNRIQGIDPEYHQYDKKNEYIKRKKK